jgi:microcystin-dependent protein
MSQLKDQQTGASGDGFTVAGTLAVTGGFTLDGSAGTAGQALLSGGSGNTPTWGAAFVSGMIILWSGSIASIPTGWVLCDGTNSTPNLRDRFVVGAGTTYAVGATGGSADATLPLHNHGITDPGHSHLYDISTTAAAMFDSTSNVQLSRVGTQTGTSVTGITINNSGSSATNANLPPYYALAYIMKT